MLSFVRISVNGSLGPEIKDAACCYGITDIRCGLHEGRRCGGAGSIHLQLVLTQHSFTVSAARIWQCGTLRGSCLFTRAANGYTENKYMFANVPLAVIGFLVEGAQNGAGYRPLHSPSTVPEHSTKHAYI